MSGAHKKAFSPQRGTINVQQGMLLGLSGLLGVLLQDWYVDGSAPGCAGGDGSSGNPFCTIQAAVDAASDGDVLHIAAGTYLETVGISMKDLTLVGAEGDALTTIDASASGRPLTMFDSTVTLTGLTLTNGSSGGVYACYGSLTLLSSTVRNNYSFSNCGIDPDPAIAGGVYMWYGGLNIVDSVIADNFACDPGAVSFYGSLVGPPLLITNSIVMGNTSLCSTGAVHTRGILTITNSLVTGNESAAGCPGPGLGCVISNYGGPLTLVNTTVSANINGGIAVDSSTVDAANSIVWNNGGPAFSSVSSVFSIGHSLIEGGWPGSGNIDVDPVFVDPMNGDYRLSAGSPCVDAGDNTIFSTRGAFVDLLGLPRFFDDPMTPDSGIGDFLPLFHIISGQPRVRPVVDMGAYEYQ